MNATRICRSQFHFPKSSKAVVKRAIISHQHREPNALRPWRTIRGKPLADSQHTAKQNILNAVVVRMRRLSLDFSRRRVCFSSLTHFRSCRAQRIFHSAPHTKHFVYYVCVRKRERASECGYATMWADILTLMPTA